MLDPGNSVMIDWSVAWYSVSSQSRDGPPWSPAKPLETLPSALWWVSPEESAGRFASGRVSRTHRLRTTVRNCTRDEGGPFEAGSQVQVSSHRELLSSRAMVVLCQEGARAPCCTRDEGGPFGAVL